MTELQLQKPTQITGRIASFLFRCADYAVIRFQPVDGGGQIVAIGNLTPYRKDEPLVLTGRWEEHADLNSRRATRFRVVAALRQKPPDLRSLELFLANSVPDCGPARARQMVQKHGEALFEILKGGRTADLLEVRGIGQSLAGHICDGFRERLHEYEVSAFLYSIDLNPNLAGAAMQALGSDVVSVASQNPYRLTQVRGIGYKTVDHIARKLGWAWNSPERAEAVLTHALQESGNEGHTFLSRTDLIARASQMLLESEAGPESSGVEEDAVNELLGRSLDGLYECKTLVKSVASVQTGSAELTYLPKLYYAEAQLARKIRILLEAPRTCRFTASDFSWMVQESEKALELELTDEQHQAAVKAFLEPISILTGGPGTGKTAVCRVIANVADQLGYSVSQCAPTGRAAKHLSNVTSAPAVTIHRLLNFDSDQNRWRHDEQNPIRTDMVISDEFSMVDIELAYRLADAIPPGTPWLIIGDKDQLPAVSPGRVLDDLIVSGEIPVTRLNKIFRQAEKSLIVQNAYRILHGDDLTFPAKKDGAEMADCYLLEPPEIPALDEKGHEKKTKGGKIQMIEDYEWIKDRIVRMCKDRIPARLQLDPIRDVQVLTPMNKKGLGSEALNEVLQDALNPKRDGVDEVILAGKRFRTNDRVQQHRNNYKLGRQGEGVCNGEVGFIVGIDTHAQILSVDFSGKDENDDSQLVEYPFEAAKHDLHLGYAMSIHKAQGCEFPVVIVVLVKANWNMLQRNLLYTAATRAKQLLVFVAGRRIIRRAVQNAVIHKRNSFLATRLRRELELGQKAAA